VRGGEHDLIGRGGLSAEDLEEMPILAELKRMTTSNA
jgi:hypothetical protein